MQSHIARPKTSRRHAHPDFMFRQQKILLTTRIPLLNPGLYLYNILNYITNKQRFFHVSKFFILISGLSCTWSHSGSVARVLKRWKMPGERGPRALCNEYHRYRPGYHGPGDRAVFTSGTLSVVSALLHAKK